MQDTTTKTNTLTEAKEAKVRVGVWALTGNPQGSWEQLARDLEFLAGAIKLTLRHQTISCSSTQEESDSSPDSRKPV